MGVSLTMKVRVAHRVYANPVDITPGLRSRCATILTQHFGASPHRLDREDIALINMFAEGASVYVPNEENVWKTIYVALHEHGGVEIEAEY